jgi:superfamily II DNA or RNA helicase
MIVEEIEAKLGKKLFDSQLACLTEMDEQDREDIGSRQRMCIYYPTGEGKTIASLASLALLDYKQAVVIAPPSTHSQWFEHGLKLGIHLHTISHAKFRRKDCKLSRTVPIIVDEFHMLGGHTGAGWTKMDTLALHLQAPLIIMSATPNYNDAERVYCIQHVLDPLSCRGGYIQFLYQHCVTQQDPFSMTPKVLGFHHFADASEYLAALPGVVYLPDELVYEIEDHFTEKKIPDALKTYGYNERRHRVVASTMERRHTIIDLSLIAEDGLLNSDIHSWLEDTIFKAQGPVLIYATHSTVAMATARTLMADVRLDVVTGKMSKKAKRTVIDEFIAGEFPVLIGTATLGTGTDGIDKICDTLIILDDTEDDAARRQLVGRIMPRGADKDSSMKQVHRLVLQ